MMNNKERYVRQLDSISAPESLKEKISENSNAAHKKRPAYKIAAAIAACLAVVIIAIPVLNNSFRLGANKESYGVNDSNYGNGLVSKDKVDYDEVAEESNASFNQTAGTSAKIERKIIRKTSYDFNVKNLDDFLLKSKKLTADFGGYISEEQCNNYDTSRYSNITFNIPSEKLDAFSTEIEKLGKVVSKNTTSTDVTNSYIDTKSRITALETEQNTLLELLKKADNLQDTIEIQSRLTEVRSTLESYKSQLKAMEGQIDYAEITVDVSEEERVIQSDGSFGSQVKEKFLSSIYSIADFFTQFTISFLGAIPYLAILAVIAVIVIVIVKKKKKK